MKGLWIGQIWERMFGANKIRENQISEMFLAKRKEILAKINKLYNLSKPEFYMQAGLEEVGKVGWQTAVFGVWKICVSVMPQL